jgi:hypothetical protein
VTVCPTKITIIRVVVVHFSYSILPCVVTRRTLVCEESLQRVDHHNSLMNHFANLLLSFFLFHLFLLSVCPILNILPKHVLFVPHWHDMLLHHHLQKTQKVREGPVSSSCSESRPCPANEECVSSGSTDQCVCRRGYSRDKDGEACQDINECTSLTASPCGMNSFCTNLDGGFVCGCPSGFTGNPYTVCYPDGKTYSLLICVIKM